MMDSIRPRSSRISTTVRGEAVWESGGEDLREVVEEEEIQRKVVLKEKDEDEGLEEMVGLEKKKVRRERRKILEV